MGLLSQEKDCEVEEDFIQGLREYQEYSKAMDEERAKEIAYRSTESYKREQREQYEKDWNALNELDKINQAKLGLD